MVVPKIASVLKELITVDSSGARNNIEIMKKASKSPQHFYQFLLFKSLDPILKETGTEQVRKILRALFAVEGYVDKNIHVRMYFYTPVCEENFPIMVLNGTQSMRLILMWTAKLSRSLWTMKNPSSFKNLVSKKSISQVNISIVTRKPNLHQACITGALILYTVQKSTEIWMDLAHAAGNSTVLQVVVPGLMFNKSQNVLKVL